MVYLGLIRPDLWLQQAKLVCKLLKQCHMYQHVELKASRVKNMGHLTEETKESEELEGLEELVVGKRRAERP